MAPQDHQGGRRFYAHRFEPPLAGQPKEIVRKYSGGKATAAGMRDPSVTVTHNDKDIVSYLIARNYRKENWWGGIVLEGVISLQFKKDGGINADNLDNLAIFPENNPTPITQNDYSELVSMTQNEEYALLFSCLRDLAKVSTSFEFSLPKRGGIDYILKVIEESMAQD